MHKDRAGLRSLWDAVEILLVLSLFVTFLAGINL